MEKEIDDIIRIFIAKIYNIIFFNGTNKLSIKEITQSYTKIYNYLIINDSNKSGNYIYTRYTHYLEEYYKNKIIPLLSNCNDNYLSKINTFYTKHKKTTKYISQLLLRYLDRYYIRQNNIKTVKEISDEIFYKQIIQKKNDIINKFIIDYLNQIRNKKYNFGNKYIILKEIIGLYHEKEKEKLLENIIKSSKYYYSDLNLENIPVYINTVLDIIKNENIFLLETMGSKGQTQIFNNLTDILIIEKIHNLQIKKYINNIFDNLEENININIINCIKLFSQRKKSFEILLPIISKNISNIYSHFLDSENFSESAEGICNLYNNCILIETEITNIISKNKFSKVFNDLYNNYFGNNTKNKFNNSHIKIFVCYLDHLLKKKNIEDKKILSVFKVFNFFSEKDYFIDLYSKFLAKRLLKNNYDFENEINIVKILKTKAELSHTYKLENMLKDIYYYEGSKSSIPLLNNIENNTKILTSNFWPKYDNIKLTKENEITKITEQIKSSYKKKNLSKKLIWNNTLSQVTIKISSLNKPYIFKMSFIEASIIYLFKKKKEIAIQNIIDLLQIEKKTLMLFINNLVKTRLFILTTQNEEKILTVNTNYKSKKIKHSLPIVSIYHTQKEKVVKNETVISRKEKISLVIVRLLKTKKTLNENQIILETIKQIKSFKPNITDITGCLQKLVNNEYISLDTSNNKLYHYEI